MLGTEHWTTLLLFICLLFLVWVKAEYPRKIQVIFREALTGELPVKEKGITLPSILLFFIYLTCLSLLLIKIAPLFVKLPFESWWEEFLTLFSILLAYYLAKTLLLLIIGFIFEVQPVAWEYISEIYIFTRLSGILLLPIAAVMIYSYGINLKFWGEIIFAAIALALVFRTGKMFILMMGKGLRTFYLILYICCLEIAPLALFIKFGLLSHLQ